MLYIIICIVVLCTLFFLFYLWSTPQITNIIFKFIVNLWSTKEKQPDNTQDEDENEQDNPQDKKVNPIYNLHTCMIEEYPKFKSINEIKIPNVQSHGKIYISDIYTAKCNNILKEYNITAVVNVSTDIYTPIAKNNLKINVTDEITTDISKHFETAYKFINEHNIAGENVLIHCHAGISRSVTIVISYLMKKYKMKYFTAMKIVQTCRNIAEPNDGFIEQLKKYEESITI